MNRIKKILIGIAFVAPLLLASAACATVTQRDVLIKGPSSNATVYYLASDGRRYVFPNQKTYTTWFSDFSGVLSVSMADLVTFPLGGNVTYRPGIKLVKITTDPKVYAVDANGTLRWITSESAAAALYGSDWNKKVDDIPDAFFTNYRIGADINGPSDYSPFSAATGATTINIDIGVEAGASPRLADTAPNAPAASPASACTSDVWTCSDWSSCTASGTQTRTCTLTTDCPNVTSASPALSQSCTASAPSATITVNNGSEAGSVAAGTDSVLAKFRLSAIDEDLVLDKASFTVATPAAVVSMRLYDGDTPVSSATSVDGAGNAFFTDVNFVINRNTAKDLTVRGVINIVGPSGVASGANAKVTMKDTGGPYVFEMRGAALGSQTVITTIPGGEQSGNDKIVRKSVPTVSEVALPTTILTQGDVVAARVNVSASASGDIGMKTLTVDVTKPNGLQVNVTGDGTHSTVRAYGDGTNLVGHSTASAGCNAGGGTFCQIRTEFTDEEDIAAGSAKTYDVRLNVAGVLATGDSLATVLDGDTLVVNGVLTAGSAADQVKVNGTDVDFAWSDLSASPHSSTVGASSADWASGDYVSVLPTDVQVLSK